jgi:hypothetical protein
MAQPSKVLFTPNGVVDLEGSTVNRHRVELRPGLMEFFRQLADFATHLQLGIHCAKCGADITGKNADVDKTFVVVCNCREFIGGNRDYREPSAAEAFYEVVQDFDKSKLS